MNTTEQTVIVDFSHRLLSKEFNPGSAADLNDAIGLTGEKAIASLEILYHALVAHGDTINDDAIECAIEAVIDKIKDIKSLARAHYEATKNNKANNG